ncbi:MAG TPA: prepilin-type N-terminal cleavage/methylation domain-containing protein [Phycisphaerae bacterium]|nr:prepilin-type N-terminal cleavage/methylation domain-containing protein [Phycisphaerae bacterium]
MVQPAPRPIDRRPRHASRARRAFTLIELLVAVVILVLLLAGVGMIFRTTSAAIGMSQANLQLLANVRAAQEQMQRDFSSIDPTTFLVVRCRKIPGGRPDAPPDYCDQVSFIANECFTNREIGQFGIDDQTVHAGLIWYGHLVVEGVNRPGANYIPVADQSKPVIGPPGEPLNVLPSGSVPEDLILGRHVTLLAGPTGADGHTVTLGGQLLPSVPLPSLYSATMDVGDSDLAHFTSSRISLTSVSTSQLMQIIRHNVGQNPQARWEGYDPFGRPPPFTETATCSRFATLLDPWATEVKKDNFTSLPNGVMRMSSIFLQSCESFHVEVLTPPLPEFHTPGMPMMGKTGDDFAAVYDGDGLPRAVRITIRVADPMHRLPGDRTFQQIIPLER